MMHQVDYRIVAHEGGWAIDHNGKVMGSYATKEAAFESAAGAVIDAILARFPRVMRVRITVHKPHAPIAATFSDVGVIISRGRGK